MFLWSNRIVKVTEHKNVFVVQVTRCYATAKLGGFVRVGALATPLYHIPLPLSRVFNSTQKKSRRKLKQRVPAVENSTAGCFWSFRFPSQPSSSSLSARCQSENQRKTCSKNNKNPVRAEVTVFPQDNVVVRWFLKREHLALLGFCLNMKHLGQNNSTTLTR